METGISFLNLAVFKWHNGVKVFLDALLVVVEKTRNTNAGTKGVKIFASDICAIWFEKMLEGNYHFLFSDIV